MFFESNCSVYYHTCTFCIVHNSIQEFTITYLDKIYYLYHDNGFIPQLSKKLLHSSSKNFINKEIHPVQSPPFAPTLSVDH